MASSRSPVPIDAEQLRAFLLARVSAGTIDIPPFPAVAMKLRQLVASGEYKLADLALVVKKDQALAAAMLRVANSPHFKRGVEITTVERAIGLLGADEACRIALATTLGAVAMQSSPLSELRQTVWRQALAAAITADYLAYVRRLNSDHGFMAGLLHDIGQLVAIAGLEAILRERHFSGNLPVAAWLELTNVYHLQIGRLVAQKWNLSALLVESIAHHHAPEGATDHRAMVEVIQTCDQIVALMDECPYLLPHDLTRLPGIRDAREADALMECLPLIPSFINSLGGANPTWQHMPTRIEKPETLLGEPRKVTRIPACWIRSIGESAGLVEAVAPDGFAIRCGEPMPEGGVARVRLSPQGSDPIEVSGRVLVTTSTDTDNHSEVRLFALPGVGKQTWEALHARCG